MEAFIVSIVEKSLSVAILVVVFLRFEKWCREQIQNERADKAQCVEHNAALTASMKELARAVRELKDEMPKRRRAARSRSDA